MTTSIICLRKGTRRGPATTTTAITRILRDAGVDDELLSPVQRCVAVHDELAIHGDELAPATIEVAVLWDADNLDAMGAIGVARAFTFGSVHDLTLWDPDGGAYSTLCHFEDRLLRLRGELHTEPACQLAADRQAFLEAFHERFRAEWHSDG